MAPGAVDAPRSPKGEKPHPPDVAVCLFPDIHGTIARFPIAPRPVPMFGRLVLQAELSGSAPSQAGETPRLEGRRGHALTPLRPSGKVDIDGSVFDVVADGEFVAVGEPVEVLRTEGIRIVVGRAKS